MYQVIILTKIIKDIITIDKNIRSLYGRSQVKFSKMSKLESDKSRKRSRVW